ncbi:MAG TPA: hypothetical protein VF088_06805 [Pyrinomonadaceae bacterium]
MNEQTRRTLFSLLALMAFLILALGSTDETQRSSYSGTGSGTSSSNGSSLAPKDSKKEILSSVKLDVKWRKGGFGSVMEADFTINNPTQYRFKDFEITCTHYAKSGTQIDSNTRTIYEVVEARSKKLIKDFNMGFIHSQAASTACEMTDVTVL